MDQWQPHENSWTACQSSQVVNWVKTKPGLAGNQIPFGGTRFGFTSIGVYNRGPRIFMGLALVHFQKYWLLRVIPYWNHANP